MYEKIRELLVVSLYRIQESQLQMPGLCFEREPPAEGTLEDCIVESLDVFAEEHRGRRAVANICTVPDRRPKWRTAEYEVEEVFVRELVSFPCYCQCLSSYQ